MAINLKANQLNAKVAITTKTWAALGFDSNTISIVYLLDPEGTFPIASWKPGDPFSQLTGIEAQKGYLIQPKIDLDRSADFAAPLPTTTTTTSTTTTTTTQVQSSGYRYATAADVIIIPQANIGDYIIDGPNTSDGVGGIIVAPNFANDPVLSGGKKILIKGGNYQYIGLNMANVQGTTDNPVIITNYDGQVRSTTMSIEAGNGIHLTGKYDVADKTGDSNFTGWDGNTGCFRGKFGFALLNNWTNLVGSCLNIGGYGRSITDVEISYVEMGDGGYAGINAKNDDTNNSINNLKIHDCYIHDTGGEGMYLGSTQPDPQGKFHGLRVYNNVVSRAGLNGFQLCQVAEDCIVENNVFAFNAVNWKDAFMVNQDQATQFNIRQGEFHFRNNVVIGGGQYFIMLFAQQYTGNPPTGPIYVENNLFYGIRNHVGAYFYSVDDSNAIVNFRFNYLGQFIFSYDKVYPNTQDFGFTSFAETYGPTPILNLINNVTDGSENNPNFLGKNGTWVINQSGNGPGTCPAPLFVETGFPDAFNYLNLEWWTRIIGTNSSFTSVGTNKGQTVTYNLNDYVVHKSKLYRSLQNNNNGNEPAGVTDIWWQLVTSSYGECIPDDWRLRANDFYANKGIGLLRNITPPVPTTTTTTTSTSSTSSTTTTSTTSIPPLDLPSIYAKDNGDNTLNLSFGVNRNSLLVSPRGVILGSSSAQGVGASSYANSWAGRFESWIASNTTGGQIFNLGLSQSQTKVALPDGSDALTNEHINVSCAVESNPDFVIINFPSNDNFFGIPPAQIVDNLKTMYNLCRSRGILCFVTTTQPRDGFGVNTTLVDTRNLIMNSFPAEFTINIFDGLKKPGTTSDIDTQYSAGDGIHVNDAGHQYIFNQVLEKVNTYYVNKNFTEYSVERSLSPTTGFTVFDTVTGGINISKDYPRQNGTTYYYRFRSRNPNGTYNSYSNVVELTQPFISGDVEQVVQLDFSVNTVEAPPFDWNNLSTPQVGPERDQVFAGLTNVEGNATGIDLTVTEIFTSAEVGGPSSGIYPIRVMQDYWRIIASSQLIRSEIVLSGLSPTNVYDVDILTAVPTGSLTRFLVGSSGVKSEIGRASTAFSIANNVPFTLKGLVPALDGTLTLKFRALKDGIAYMNAMVLKRRAVTPSTTTTTTSSTTTTTTTAFVPANASNININFYDGSVGYDNNTSNIKWNNFNVSPTGSVNLNNLTRETGASSTISVQIGQIANVVDNGASYGGGAFPATVLRHAMRAGYTVLLTFTGLNPARTYDFDFMASRAYNQAPIGARWRIGNPPDQSTTNLTTVDQDASYNFSTVSTIAGITPSSGGVIIVRWDPRPGDAFQYFNAMKIKENAPATTTTTTSSTSSTSTSSTSSTSTSSTSSTSSTTTTTTTNGSARQFFSSGGPNNNIYYTATGSKTWVYLPPNYDPNRAQGYSLIIFMHGAGEVGTDINKVLVTGLPKRLNLGQNHESVILCPQENTFNWFSERGKAAYDYGVNNFNIDTNRVYVTGLSAGGGGTSNFVTAYPNLVAAYIICATVPTTIGGGSAAAVRELGAMFVHGFADQTQSIGNSMDAVMDLNALVPTALYPPIIYTYWTGDHNEALWNGKCYDITQAGFNFETDFLLLYNKDKTITATNFVVKAEQSPDHVTYGRAKWLVDKLSNGSAKTALLNRLSAVFTSFTNNKRIFVVDPGVSNYSQVANTNKVTNQTNGTTTSNLVDISGSASTYAFVTVSSPWAGGRDYAPANAYFGFDPTSYRDVFRVYGASNNTWKFTGLNNSYTYDVRLFYSNQSGIATSRTGFSATIGGTTKNSVEDSFNTTRYLEFTGVSPVAGEIVMSMGTLYGYEAYIGVITLRENIVGTTTTTTSTSSTTTTTTTGSGTTTTTTTSSTTTTTTTASAAATQVNFSRDPRSVAGWINATGSGISPTNFGASWNDPVTGITLQHLVTDYPSSLTKWGAEFAGQSSMNNGETVDDGGGFIPNQDVLRDSWWSNNVVFDGDTRNQFKWTGLIVGRTYTLRFYASLDNSFGLDADPTVFTVNNNMSGQEQINAVGNTSNFAEFTGVAPDISGEIPWNVGVTVAAQFGILSAATIQIEP